MGEIDETFGALYIGTVIAMVLFGITILQTYFYYLHYNHDSLLPKLLVMSICLLDCVHSVAICHANYYYLVSGLQYPAHFRNAIWSLYVPGLLTLPISVLAQGFYITRIYRLCRPRWKWWICSPIIIATVAHFASGVEINSKIFSNKTLSLNQIKDGSSVITLSVINIICDTMITVVLCVLLRNRRSEVQESRMNYIINNIIVFCLERFLLCMVIAVVEFGTYLAFPYRLYTAAIDMVEGKLVVNSLLATLNSRQALKGAGVRGDLSTTDDTTTSIPLSTPVRTAITGMYKTGTIAESSIDDAQGYALRTRDLEASIQSDES